MRPFPSTKFVLYTAVTSITACAVSEAPRSSVQPVYTVNGNAAGAEGQYALGQYYLSQNRRAQAVIAFSKALDADPKHVGALNARAALFAGFGDLDSAARDFEVAIQLKPDAAHLYNNLGYTRFQQGRHAEADDAYRKALAIEPGNARAIANLTQLAGVYAGTQAPKPVLAAAAPAQPVAAAEAAVAAPAVAASQPAVAVQATAPTPVQLPRTTQNTSTEILAGAVLDLSKAMVDAAATGKRSMIRTNPDQQQLAGSVVDLRDPSPATAEKPLPMLTDARRSPTPEAVGFAEAAAAAPSVAPARNPRIEVSNGNGVPGMARKVGERFRARGMEVVKISNASSFNIPDTRVLFREGYMGEAVALSRSIPGRPGALLDTRPATGRDIQVSLGKDVVKYVTTVGLAPRITDPRPMTTASLLGLNSLATIRAEADPK